MLGNTEHPGLNFSAVRLGDKLATCSCKKKKKKKRQPKRQLPLTRVFLRINPFSYIIILYPQRASMAEGE